MPTLPLSEVLTTLFIGKRTPPLSTRKEVSPDRRGVVEIVDP